MNSHSFLMLGSTFIFGAFASTWAPDTTWLHYLYISLLICIPLTLIRQYIGALCISFFAGALLVISSTLGVLENHVQLPTNQRVVEAVGTVLDYPDVNVWRARFELQIISSNRTEIKAGHKFQINCYECPYSVQRGDTWQLILKLKPPHGYANAAGFDYEKWLLRNRIHATGYVKDHAASKLIRAANLGPIGQTRIRIGRWLESHDQAGTDGFAATVALMLGDRSGFSDELWSTFRRTGIVHIFAISGLHIGLVWLFISVATRWFSRLFPSLYLYVPAPFIGGWCGVSGAAVYAATSGWGIPVQRALLMLVLFQVNQSFGNRRCPFHALLLAAVLILLIDPLAVLDMSYWMSCYAVLVLTVLTHRDVGGGVENCQPAWRHFLSFQIKLNILMAPITLMLFSEVSLIAPLVNIVLLPLLGGVLLPILFLLACLFLSGANTLATSLLLHVASGLDWVASVLRVISEHEFSAIRASYSSGLYPITLLFVLTLLRFRKVPVRGLNMPARPMLFLFFVGTTLLISSILFRSEDLVEGEFEVHVLDVGQGLSVIVRGASKTLMYDTGARFRNGSTVADTVIIPWLQYYGIRKLDYLVISHGDSDHIGGMDSLVTTLEIGQIHTSVESLLSTGKSNPVSDCETIDKFSFDGVRAEYLSGSLDYLTANDRSCVLKLSGVGGSILFSGDIEKQAEGDLVEIYRERIKSDVLVVPHHGSKTSSRPIFLEAVQPSEAAISSGFLNSYRHPAADIVDRYNSRDIEVGNTALSGTLSYYFTTTGVRSMNYRNSSPRLWRGLDNSAE